MDRCYNQHVLGRSWPCQSFTSVLRRLAGTDLDGLSSDFCSSVNYNAARMYPSSFTFFETSDPFDYYTHQRSAALFFRDMFQDIANNTESLKLTSIVDAIETCVSISVSSLSS